MGFYLSKGLFTKHDSLAAAAQHMGVPAEALAAEVEAYNAAAAAGRDAFGKSVFPSTVDPAAEVYVAKITPVVHYTMVGARRVRVHTCITCAGRRRPPASKFCGSLLTCLSAPPLAAAGWRGH
jgi:hypothetical protein